MGILLYLVASSVLFTLFALFAGINSTLWGFVALHWICAIWVLYCVGAAITRQDSGDQLAQETRPVPDLSSLANVQQKV
jgi:hypothetical protein